MTNQNQLELGFDGSRGIQLVVRPARQPGRAQWWFQQMRQVVDCALDWQPVPPPRPEQTWFPGARREARV